MWFIIALKQQHIGHRYLTAITMVTRNVSQNESEHGEGFLGKLFMCMDVNLPKTDVLK